MTAVRSPKQVARSLTELWSPRVIGEIDDAYIKVAKVKGSLAWHRHELEDELFTCALKWKAVQSIWKRVRCSSSLEA